MKNWSQPKLVKLDVVSTKHGQDLKVIPDGAIYYNGFTWYSFS